ncbi:MAG: hypothetical protein L0287_03940, partial [Anaerolineae bacterium]|nr:hypothetical protein [Anaerolineae bacterium]
GTKGAVQGGIKAGLKEAVGVSAKETIQATSKQAAGNGVANALNREDIMSGLVGFTQQGNRVASGLADRSLGLNVLGDDLFAKAWKQKGGQGAAPQAFAYGEQTYVRGSSQSLLSEVVHEGTHGLDYLRGFSGSTVQLEKRAWFYERQFQRASGSKVEFENISEMLNHIKDAY